MCAWRITREIARVRGLIVAAQEPLAALSTPRWKITDLTAAPEAVGDLNLATLRLAQNTTLDPAHCDPVDFATLALFVSEYLRFPGTGPSRAALNYLLENPHTNWPSTRDLIEHDEDMIQSVAQKILKGSTSSVARSLERTYGLLAHESRNLVLLAKASYVHLQDAAPAVNKAFALARLEEFATRMRTAMQPREELQALKTIATIQGLTKPEPSEEEEDLTDVIARVCQDAQPPPGNPALPES